MREGIHPTWYPDAKAVCSCGNSWIVGSTIQVVRTDVCNACHPFFTGEQRIVDTEGQVDRFYQRLEKREQIHAEIESQRDALESGAVPLAELGLGTRTLKVLQAAGFESIAEIIAQLEQGEETLLSLQGFGQKSLIEVRKRLRAGGYIK